MIVPTKHIRFSESLFGLGAIILSILSEPQTVDELWHKFSDFNNDKLRFPSYHSFDHLVLAIDYLYLIGAIDVNNKGEIYNAAS